LALLPRSCAPWQAAIVVIAAFVVSVVALIIALVSAGYTRLQGVETRRLRQIEASRRQEERTPRLAGEVESVNDGGWFRLWLTLESTTPLLGLAVRIVQGEGVSFTSGQNGVAPMQAHPLDAVYDKTEPFTQGNRHAWAIEFDPEHGPSRMRVRVTCRGLDDNGDDVTWPVLVDIDLPIDLRRTVG
jgi:hypothetical protein